MSLQASRILETETFRGGKNVRPHYIQTGHHNLSEGEQQYDRPHCEGASLH